MFFVCPRSDVHPHEAGPAAHIGYARNGQIADDDIRKMGGLPVGVVIVHDAARNAGGGMAVERSLGDFVLSPDEFHRSAIGYAGAGVDGHGAERHAGCGLEDRSTFDGHVGKVSAAGVGWGAAVQPISRSPKRRSGMDRAAVYGETTVAGKHPARKLEILQRHRRRARDAELHRTARVQRHPRKSDARTEREHPSGAHGAVGKSYAAAQERQILSVDVVRHFGCRIDDQKAARSNSGIIDVRRSSVRIDVSHVFCLLFI